jgi:hypothetical protein
MAIRKNPGVWEPGHEEALAGIMYLDMLQRLIVPQLDEDGLEIRIHF